MNICKCKGCGKIIEDDAIYCHYHNVEEMLRSAKKKAKRNKILGKVAEGAALLVMAATPKIVEKFANKDDES